MINSSVTKNLVVPSQEFGYFTKKEVIYILKNLQITKDRKIFKIKAKFFNDFHSSNFIKYIENINVILSRRQMNSDIIIEFKADLFNNALKEENMFNYISFKSIDYIILNKTVNPFANSFNTQFIHKIILESFFNMELSSINEKLNELITYFDFFDKGIRKIDIEEKNEVFKLIRFKMNKFKFSNLDFKYIQKIAIKNYPTHRFDSEVVIKYYNSLLNNESLNHVYNNKSNKNKPIIFVPCASEKPIIDSKTHRQFFHKLKPFGNIVILSEPLTAVPYDIDKNSVPTYDYPPESLWLLKDDVIFVNNLAKFINKFCLDKKIYYILPLHHFKILDRAIKKSNINYDSVFGYTYERPELGFFLRMLIRDIAKSKNAWLPSKTKADYSELYNFATNFDYKEFLNRSLSKFKIINKMKSILLINENFFENNSSVLNSKNKNLTFVIFTKEGINFDNKQEFNFTEIITLKEKDRKLNRYHEIIFVANLLELIYSENDIFFFLKSNELRIILKSLEINKINKSVLKGQICHEFIDSNQIIQTIPSIS